MRFDRHGRSLKDLIQLVIHLESKNISLKSYKESIVTSFNSGKLVFHILELWLVRTKFDKRKNKAARVRGRIGGRPKVLTHDKRALAVKLYEEKNHTIDDL